MKFIFSSFISIFMIAMSIANAEITTVSNKRCVTGKWIYRGSVYSSCALISGTGVASCAVEVNDDGLAIDVEECQTLTPCPRSRGGQACIAFSYQGVDYPAGSCAYRDSYSDRPWCRIAASGIFAGASGILNWDFCDDQCGAGSGSAGPPGGASAGQSVVINTNTSDCLGEYKTEVNGAFMSGCIIPTSRDIPFAACATEVDANQVVTQFSPCMRMRNCSRKTLNGRTCEAFRYRGIDYAVNECSYVDSVNSLPWCATESVTNDASYTGLPGHGNWDYCNPTCVPNPTASTRVVAMAQITDASGADGSVTGTVMLVQDTPGGLVSISGDIMGLTPGLHGFHVHEMNMISNNCNDAGGHFNPTNMNHGAPDARARHLGDLGNIETPAGGGVTTFSITDTKITLEEQVENSIIGRTFVIHADQDDLGLGDDEGSTSTGNAGARLACGVITKGSNP